jgi:opacity protein-like surface antigen
MGGVGLGGRARPDRAVAVDLTLDSLTGIDYVGHRRDELGVNLATSVFFNPHDPVQGFFAAGIGWSRANASYASGATKINNTYHYFGMFAGLGLEWQVKSHFSLDLALLGMLRSRTDADADNHPEFIDPNTKLVTNSSGAGLVRLGLLYYF